MAQVATPTAVHASQRQHTGRLVHIHRPPIDQKDNDSNLKGDYFSTAPRKRQRAESSLADEHTGWQQQQQWLESSDTPGHDDAGILSTESLLSSDRYRLRGGFDTPGLLADSHADRLHNEDVGARRRMRDEESKTQPTEPAFAGPLARERNGYSRSQLGSTLQQTHVESSPSWTRFALTLPLSIAGKMFSFGGAVLKGFYAGGGEGYELGENAASTPTTLRRQQSSFAPGTPIPGAWHESPPLSQQDSCFFVAQADSGPIRPAPNKRRLTDRDTWVVVGTPDLEVATPPSPRRRTSAMNSPRLLRPSGSRTGSRRSMLAASKRHSYMHSTGSPAQSYQPGPNTLLTSPSRQHSHVRQTSPLHSHDYSAVTPDTDKLRRRQVKQERAADRTMSNMSKQLEELIRQGQEALGTKFVVEEDRDPEDEGFVDDE